MAEPARDGAAPVSAGPADAYGAPLPLGLHRLTAFMNAVGTLWILALMVLINADVIGRDLFAHPLRGVTEFVAMSIVGIVFLQLADTLHAGRITRADVLLGRLQRTRPAWADELHALFHMLGALLLGIILWASAGPLAESIRIREYVGAIGDFQLPVWPVRAITLLGLAVTTLTYAMLAWCDLRRLQARRRT